MDIKNAINRVYNDYVTQTFKNDLVRSFLLNHERKHILIDNLKNQIDRCSHIIMPMDISQEDKRKIIKNLALDFAKTFCKTALDVKEAELQKLQLTVEQAIKAHLEEV